MGPTLGGIICLRFPSKSGFFMKIVILDGHAINPGDLSWDALRSLGSLEVFDRTPESLIVPRAREATLAASLASSGRNKYSIECRPARSENQEPHWSRRHCGS